MILDIVILLITLVLIVGSSELFTNGIEWLGQRLNLSEGVVGSVLAAVGTALPETLIPIVALLFYGHQNGAEVGIGAIAGAPFMLSTLTLGLCGLTCLLCTKSGRREPGLDLKSVVIRRDLKFFMLAYCIALGAAFLPVEPELRYWRLMVAVLLVLIYPLYLYKSFSHEGEVGVEPEKLYLDRLINFGSTRFRLIVPQIFLGLAGITGGAYVFVHYIQDIANYFGVAPLLLSLIVSPIATEAPEKINSIIWLRAKKDTLAVGNVTGALVFQSCFPVAFGVAFTAWRLDMGTFLSGVVAVCSAFVYFCLLRADRLRPLNLLTGMLVYLATITAIIHFGLYKQPLF